VIIDDLHIARSIVRPYKANAILSIDPNAVLSSPIAAQRFQAIAGWNSQFFKFFDRVELI